MDTRAYVSYPLMVGSVADGFPDEDAEMDDTKDRRRSPRLYVTLPATYKVLPAKVLDMPKELAEVYERVHPNPEQSGETLQGMVRDLSANGAFITGPTVPLLSRILLTFPLPGMANIEAIGWVLWRRRDDCMVEKMVPGRSDPVKVTLSMGFGILFEAIPSPARRHIHRLARMNSSLSKLDSLDFFSSRMEDTGEFLADEDLEEVPEVEEGSQDDVTRVEIERAVEKESPDFGQENSDTVSSANSNQGEGEDETEKASTAGAESGASSTPEKKRVPIKTEELEQIEEIEEFEEIEEIGEIQEVEKSETTSQTRDFMQASGEIGSSNETGGPADENT